MPWLKRADSVKNLLKTALFSSCFLFCLSAFGQESSILNTGKWYKLAVTKTGIHKIDANLLKAMGINIASLTPAQIQIFGNGGSMLPQKNAAPRQKDLIQNAIWVSGEDDGKFDSKDAIYFYAEGSTVISYDSIKATLRHQTNSYTDTNFYFLTVGNANGLRIKNAASISGSSSKIVNQFTDYWFHELESENLLKSGRSWWGEYIGGSNGFTVQADIPGVVPSSDVKLLGAAIGAAQVNTSFSWKLNGQTVGESTIDPVGSGTYDLKGKLSEVTFSTTASASPSSAFSIGITYNKKGQNSAQAFLDYFGLQVNRDLRVYGSQQTYYFLPETADTVTYQIKNTTSDWLFWNITDPLHPESLSINTANGSATSLNGKAYRKYIGFLPTQALNPVSWQPVGNQNIVANEAPDMIIVTPAAWKSEALRLAAYRQDHDNLDVMVVTTSEIYNEFASGKPDPTAIRDFVRKLYKKSTVKLKYVLLFGDATYDYRNVYKNQTQTQRNGWVPVYESRESLGPVLTYSSDDYYSFMEDKEGEWAENFSDDNTMDIAIGRLPVKSVAEARIVVDKLINYDSAQSKGNWKNTISFVADDGDGNIHQRQADELAQFVNTDFLPKRIFLDALPQTITDEGQKAPGVNKEIQKSINNGTLILNYTGHGGVGGWAQEQVLTLSDMLSARGYDNLPLLLTATCDFGRYDDPALVSGAELMVLSPKGAAIGAVSTTRPVYSSTNFALSRAFYTSVVKAGAKTRLGDIFKETKNNAIVGIYNRNFALLGDPSIRLGKPEKNVRWTQKPDTLKAAKKVNLAFEIFDKEIGKVDSTFNGIARVVVFDKKTPFQTLGDQEQSETYSEFTNKLFDGNATVINGKITCEFAMPKDIDYRLGTGRVSIYAISSDTLSDASGQLDVPVGGSAALLSDTTPPLIDAYLNDDKFKDGDMVADNSPVLYIRLKDENGINISDAGIGHGITMTLNDTLTVVLNNYYTADTDNYTSGEVRYPFEDLPSGNYTIRIKVWDTYTNYSEIAFGFLVGNTKGIKLSALKVYPNPFDRELSFELSHDRADEDVEVVFHLLANSGQKIGSYHWQYYNSESVIRESVTSTGLENIIIPLIPYLYSIEIKSLKDNSVDKRSGRIIRYP